MDHFPKKYRSFHPRDPASGTLNYDIGALNTHQKRRLSLRKAIERNQNEVYLNKHPEIEGLILILIRHVLHRQPSMNIHETIGEFFNRPRYQILVDLLQYLLHTENMLSLENESQMLNNICMDDTEICYCHK